MTEIVFPIHPRTMKKLNDAGLMNLLGKVTIMDPVGYFEMISLLSSGSVLLTDSGGMQRELLL